MQTIAIAGIGAKAVRANGSRPPSGKSAARSRGGPSATAIRADPEPRLPRSTCTSAASARKAPATGLASEQPRPSATASTRRPRWNASSDPSPSATPSANGIRPEISEVVAASPNQRLPQRAPGPKWARASGSKIAAAATEEIAPTTSGPSSQASGGANKQSPRGFGAPRLMGGMRQGPADGWYPA